MRPIDADEVLKRWGLKFYAMGGDRLGPNGDEISFYVNGLLNEIQNAPTVNAIPNKEGYEMYNKGYMSGYERGKEERPQGEWQLHGMIYYCSECGHECGESGDNFCGNCGADMRKEEET